MRVPPKTAQSDAACARFSRPSRRTGSLAGRLVTIDRPINKDTELHPLVRWQFIGGIPEDERKAFLFTNIVDSKGRRYETPVAVGALAASPQIYAIGMGRPVSEIGEAWLSAIANPIPPKEITVARCQEVIVTGDELTRPGGGLARLPVPVSTPGFDLAPLFDRHIVHHQGSGKRNPEHGNVSRGSQGARPAGDQYGGQARWRRRLGSLAEISRQRRAHADRDRDRRRSAVIFTSPQKLPIDVAEFGVAGALAGAPIETVKCKTIDLQVPANCEFVIEGWIDPKLFEPEAPFGESNGYVALEEFNMPMQVTAITHKKSPVFNAIISQVTPSESSVIKKVAYEPLFLDHLRNHLSIKGVKRVVLHEPLTNLRPVVFIQYAFGTPKSEVWRGLYGTSSFVANIGKITIAVSEDIDPSSVDAVLWSLAYRSRPLEDMLIAPHRGGVQGSHFGPGAEDSTLLVDATQKHKMPPLALPAREFMENAHHIWQELGFPTVKRPSPWHGYSLGEWSETLATICRPDNCRRMGRERQRDVGSPKDGA